VTDDKRLIEDFLPIEQISERASTEPNRIKGHPANLHIWRARRPLVACRAAIYSALVPATADRKREGDFLTKLCRYPGDPTVIAHAQQRILESHATRNAGAGGSSRPKILDPFAGGGAIPLEALRLGCESYSADLNPVAYVIELCTTRYPQEFGSGLADEVERWARWVLDRVQPEIGDLYPQIPLARPKESQRKLVGAADETPCYLTIVAYYWTRTVVCPNPKCKGTVPLYRQTWLRKKASGFIALRPIVDKKQRKVFFEVVEGTSENSLGFDPGEGSEGSATTCPFCQSAVTGAYVREFGEGQGFGQQLMCIIALNPSDSGKLYVVDSSLTEGEEERQATAAIRADSLERELGPNSLDQVIPPTGNAGLATGNSYLYGIRTFRQMFLPRQRFVLLSLVKQIRLAHETMLAEGMAPDRAKAVCTYLGVWLSRLTDKFNNLCRWNNVAEVIAGISSMKRFAMMWDYPEVNLFGGSTGDAWTNLTYISAIIRQEGQNHNPATCRRASATDAVWPESTFDAVITDPPYYDNESYSELSDVCYVWLRLSIGSLYPEHFASALTPKRQECVAAAYRQGGKDEAKSFFEKCLFQSLQQCHRALKDSGLLVIMYAHKTTSAWATLVDAIRRAGFEVSEAWPIETEVKARVAHAGDAAMASSIFISARKRGNSRTGSYEEEVRPSLEAIVSERVETLWENGVSGADLVIACVGAGLRAFTRFAKVEFANGDEVPAERFLSEVETVVLETILTRLSKEVSSRDHYGLVGIDHATRFYTLWRYTYKAAELEPGEAIIFANGTHVELDGLNGLTSGPRPLVEKKKGKYRLLDYNERGDSSKLGMSSDSGQPAPLIDALHRLLWLLERRPSAIPEFLREARPNTDQLRLVAQALAGPALKGSELEEVASGSELAALAKLTANWRSVVEEEGPLFKASAQRE
jgi:putative DNA methylase